MSESAFSVGDVVQLKSGGPPMTMALVDKYGCHCQWFDPEGKVRSGAFKPEQLAKRFDPKLGDPDGVPLVAVASQMP
jgi:uncharacterized protein YodC (DUF2158 family)